MSDTLTTGAAYQDLCKAGFFGYFIADIGGHILEANDAFLRLVKYTESDMKAGLLSWQALTPAEFQERDKTAAPELMSKGFIGPYPKQYICKDGTRVDVLVGIALVKNGSGLGIAYVIPRE